MNVGELQMNITNFGVFVGLEDGLEGLLHISELADHKVENPEEIVQVGEEIQVKILRVDADERKIGLSRKRVEWAEEAEAAAGKAPADQAPPSTGIPATELKGGVGDSTGPLIQPVSQEPEKPKPEPEPESKPEPSEGPPQEESAESQEPPAGEAEQSAESESDKPEQSAGSEGEEAP